MSTYLYSYTPTPDSGDPENPSQPNHAPQENSAYVGELSNGDYVHLLPNEDAAATLVGHWDNGGSLAVVDPVAYAELRPLGNENRVDDEGTVIATGVATDALDLTHYQGHAQRHLQAAPAPDTMPEYPEDTQPFTLRITRTLTTDDAWPHIPWGWTVEVFSQDPTRDITARAIGIYDDSDTYLYTTGAFILSDFEEWNEGEPVIVQRYATFCPIGQRQASAGPIYFKLLLGSAPEGAWTLSDLEEGATDTKLFWKQDMI